MYSNPAAERARIALESAEAMRRYREAKSELGTSPERLARLWEEVCYWAEREMEEKQ